MRYSRRETGWTKICKFWRRFLPVDNQQVEFYQHIFESENRSERGRMNLQKGHSCVATVAIFAFNCGSFANSKRRNGNTGGLLRWFKTGFPLWLEDFVGHVFVDIIRHYQNQETHPDPPCREGGKDKETLSNLPIERVEVGLLAFLFRLPQAAFVLSSLQGGSGWVSEVGP